ncbi:MAG: type II secretion system protein M [Agathobacter sp.]|nr:type II secretion system protein M [Agathobacter sp.]
MKKQLTVREKVLMCVLAVLLVICAYYYAFYTPVLQKIADYKNEMIFLEEQNVLLDAQVGKMNQMKSELDAIEAGKMGEVKELPAFDNSQNVMNSLSFILQSASQYNVSFSSVEEEESTVRRNINLAYDCTSYDAAKSILSQIYESEYRSLIKDVHMSCGEDSYHVTVEITYFEYK